MDQPEVAVTRSDQERSAAPLGDVEKALEVPSDSDPESTDMASSDEKANGSAADFDWDTDPSNPYNWPSWKKTAQIVFISAAAFLT